MPSDGDPGDDPISPPGGFCYLTHVLVEVHPQGDDTGGMTHDFEMLTTTPLTEDELFGAAFDEMAPWISTMANSPKWRDRFGQNPLMSIVAVAVVKVC